MVLMMTRVRSGAPIANTKAINPFKHHNFLWSFSFRGAVSWISSISLTHLNRSYHPKLSFGQGNIFRSVCLSTAGGGVMISLRGQHPPPDSTPILTRTTPWTAPPPDSTSPLTAPWPSGPHHPYPGQQVGCTHPTGMLSCLQHSLQYWFYDIAIAQHEQLSLRPIHTVRQQLVPRLTQVIG